MTDISEEKVQLIAQAAAKAAVEEFHKVYDLRPEHWVFISAEYEKAKNSNNLIRKLVITSIVTLVVSLTLGAYKNQIKSWAIDASRPEQKHNTRMVTNGKTDQ